MENRIYRSNTDVILGGVCAGVGEYFDIDPTIIRIIWAIAFFSGFGFLAYIIAWIVIPRRPFINPPQTNSNYNNRPENDLYPGVYRDETLHMEQEVYMNENIDVDGELDMNEDIDINKGININEEIDNNEGINTNKAEQGEEQNFKQTSNNIPNNNQHRAYNNKNHSDRSSKIIGIGLIVVGAGYLAKEFFRYININDKMIFSVLFIIIGLALIIRKNK